jgi:hypothetical protein
MMWTNGIVWGRKGWRRVAGRRRQKETHFVTKKAAYQNRIEMTLYDRFKSKCNFVAVVVVVVVVNTECYFET